MHSRFKMAQSVYRSENISQDEYHALKKGEMQLERMYPSIYYIVYPEVVKHCNVMDRTYGHLYTPTKKQVEDMVETIHTNVQPKLDQVSEEIEKKQYRGGYLGDIISIVLLGELIGRRRRRRRYYYGGYPRRRPYGRY